MRRTGSYSLDEFPLPTALAPPAFDPDGES